MKLFLIKTQGLNLTDDLTAFPPSSLRENLIWSYHHHLQREFEDIFSVYQERAYLMERLTQLLKDNWQLTKHTCLAYTCLPTHPITQLMLGIAEFISKEKSEPSIMLQTLMPELELESIREGYPDLSDEKFQSAKAVTKILQTHILSDGATYLIPIRLLTELPFNEMSNPINPYFNYANMRHEQSSINQGELQRLFFHSLPTKVFYNHLKTYREVVDQQDHLLGQLRQLCRGLNLGSRYGEGSELQAGGSAYASIIEFNNFYNRLFSKKLYRYSELPADLSECNQSYLWINHKELYFIQDNAPQKIILTDKKAFKKILRKLSEGLEDAWEMRELNPQEMYYLIEKNSGFPTVDPRISSYLQQEIRNLVDYATNAKLNLTATVRAETCVATIRQALLTHITAQEELLSSFKLASNSPENIDKIHHDTRDAQLQLLDKLNTDSYHLGHDGLENYGFLISKLDINFEITSLFQLKGLLGLKPENLKSIFEHEILRQQAIFLFADQDALLGFMMDLTSEKLALFVSILKIELGLHFLKTVQDWSYILAILDTERAAIIFNPMAADILKKPEDLILLANPTGLATFQMICHAQKELLQSQLNPLHFLEVIKRLEAPAHKTFWIDYFLSDFKDGFDSIELFAQLSPYLNPEQINMVFKVNRLKLLEDLKDAEDVSILMSNCLESHQLWVFERILDKISTYAIDISTLEQIIKLAPEPYFELVCERLNLKVETHLKKAKQLYRILQSLTPENRSKFFNHFEILIFKIVILEITVGKLLNLRDLLRAPLFYRNLYNQLLSVSDEKSCFAFILSLALDDSYIKRDFERLFSSKERLTFFAKPIHPELIIGKLLDFPEPQVKKIFQALDLDCEDNRDMRKQALKSHIQELQAQPSAQKKTKLTPA